MLNHESGPSSERELPPIVPRPPTTASSEQEKVAHPQQREPQVVDGNILNQKVDAIVNPWNNNFFRGWRRPFHLKLGLSGAITKAAGDAPFRDLSRLGKMAIGDAVSTHAGDLPFKRIVHVAGIRWIIGATEYSVTRSTEQALELASAEGLTSIAFPLIGTGHGGMKPERAEELMRAAIKRSDYKGQVILVRFNNEPYNPRPKTSSA